jgi:hypothetical protein
MFSAPHSLQVPRGDFLFIFASLDTAIAQLFTVFLTAEVVRADMLTGIPADFTFKRINITNHRFHPLIAPLRHDKF